jgi:hypothetical protein
VQVAAGPMPSCMHMHNGARWPERCPSPAAAAAAAVAEVGAIPQGNAPGQTLWQQRRCAILG